MSKLKPCPFCGGKAQNITEYHEDIRLFLSYVNCTNCGMWTGFQHYQNEAIEIWNRRVSDE